MKERERDEGERETETRIYFKGYGNLWRNRRKKKARLLKGKEHVTSENWKLQRNCYSLCSCHESISRVFHLGITPFKIQIPREFIPFAFTWLTIRTPLIDLERTEHLQYSFDCGSGQLFMKIQDTNTRRNNVSWTNKMFVQCSFYHSNSILRWGNQVPEVKGSLQSMTRPELQHHFHICQNFPHFASFSPSYIQFF